MKPFRFVNKIYNYHSFISFLFYYFINLAIAKLLSIKKISHLLGLYDEAI